MLRSTPNLVHNHYFLGWPNNNNNNTPSVIPQVESREDKMYADHSPIFMGVEKLFPIDSRLKGEVIQRSVARRKK